MRTVSNFEIIHLQPRGTKYVNNWYKLRRNIEKILTNLNFPKTIAREVNCYSFTTRIVCLWSIELYWMHILVLFLQICTQIRYVNFWILLYYILYRGDWAYQETFVNKKTCNWEYRTRNCNKKTRRVHQECLVQEVLKSKGYWLTGNNNEAR